MISLDYEEMLRSAYSRLQPGKTKHERFEIPKPYCSIIGIRTILHNFKEICNVLNRDPNKVLKFLSREMATAGNVDGGRAIFQGKFPKETLERLIKRYASEFVMCPICKRPDTRVVKEKRFNFLICEACGAKSSIRPV